MHVEWEKECHSEGQSIILGSDSSEGLTKLSLWESKIVSQVNQAIRLMRKWFKN